MKKIGLICATALVCVSLTACGSQSTKAKNSSSEISSLKKENSQLKHKHHKKQNKKKQSSSSSASSNSNSGNQQANSTQQSNANKQVQNNNAQQSNNNAQDQRPSDVPANFKEYTSYTTDGHKMTQWNDAGSYCGDPDVQYQTIKMQTDEGF